MMSNPTYKVVPKEKSWFMWGAYYGMLMFLWKPDFMSEYTTQMGHTIYMPARYIGTASGARIIAHELQHIRDWEKWGLFFWFSYWLPIPFGPGNLRWVWELRAYRISMDEHVRAAGSLRRNWIEEHVELFAGPAYLWMMPFRWVTRRAFAKHALKMGYL